jgi:DNA gyrase subunit A
VWTTDHSRLHETGPIVAARVVHPEDQITVITSSGIMLRTHVSQISQMGRSTRGVRIVNLDAEDTVAALAVIGQKDLEPRIEDTDTLMPSTPPAAEVEDDVMPEAAD